MTEIAYIREREIDILSLAKDLKDSSIEELAQTISTLRQQGSQRLLLLGQAGCRVHTNHLEDLALPMRVFRETGGIVAVAEFDSTAQRQLRSASWYRYLNVFRTREEALQFLNHSSTIDETEKP